MPPRRGTIVGQKKNRGRPSPLGRRTVTLSPPADDLETSSAKRRKWTSPVWDHYDITEGEHFPDGIPRAICKYCKGGPTIADSRNGTSNFKRHTESCYARVSADVGQLLIGKDGKLAKKYEHSVYKELVALAIIRHGYTFTVSEHEGNRAIHLYLNDNCKPISRNTAKNHCLKVHKREKERLRKSLDYVPGKICLTCDMWTSSVGHGFLSLTAHYVDIDWNLNAKILNFCHVPPPHNANVLHDKVYDLLKDWKLQKKIFTITLDNARCNDNMEELLAYSLSVHSPLPCGGRYFHVRCGAHILNLIVQDGLKIIDVGVHKVRRLVKHVTASEARSMKFEEIALSVGINCSRSLWLDCSTRWNSTYKMLERALIYRDAFCAMRRMDRTESSDSIHPSDQEWSRIEKISALLQPFDEITKQFSGRDYPTSNLYFRNVVKIERLLLKYILSEDAFLRDMASQMMTKFQKYWDCYSMVLSFAAILDPRYKLQFIRYCFRELDPTTAELKYQQVKDEFYKLYEGYTSGDSQVNVDTSSRIRKVDDIVAGFADFDQNVSPIGKSELDVYIDESRLDPTLELDILSWWKDNGHRFPSVANMARDILSIPITTVASESAFSMGGRILTKWRASLKPENAEALLTTRTWIFGYEVEGDKDNQELHGLEAKFSKLNLVEHGDEQGQEEEEEEEEEVEEHIDANKS